MNHSHDSEPNFEKLSKAITEAVMTSGKVRKIVDEIQEKEILSQKEMCDGFFSCMWGWFVRLF